MTTGERIKEARKKAGLTQRELAEKLEVATITMRQYESDKREPKSFLIRRLSEELGVTMAYLLGDSDDPGDKTKTHWMELFDTKSFEPISDEAQEQLEEKIELEQESALYSFLAGKSEFISYLKSIGIYTGQTSNSLIFFDDCDNEIGQCEGQYLQSLWSTISKCVRQKIYDL